MGIYVVAKSNLQTNTNTEEFDKYITGVTVLICSLLF